VPSVFVSLQSLGNDVYVTSCHACASVELLQRLVPYPTPLKWSAMLQQDWQLVYHAMPQQGCTMCWRMRATGTSSSSTAAGAGAVGKIFTPPPPDIHLPHLFVLLGGSYSTQYFNYKLLNFLQLVSIACYAERCTSYDRFPLSVGPFVLTVRYQVKMTQATIMRSSLEDSPMILVSSWLTSARHSKGNIESEGAEWERGKKRHFLANKSPYLRNGAK